MNCLERQDDCVAHPDYVFIGQNTNTGFDTVSISPEAAITKAITKWHDEASKTSQHHLLKIGGTRAIGHFTQIVNDRACKLGCALTQWRIKNRFFYYVVCNYSFGNLVMDTAYKSKGDECKMGNDHVYGSLCSRNETHVIHQEVAKSRR